jgi:putative ABC transport system substrate-binding protein
MIPVARRVFALAGSLCVGAVALTSYSGDIAPRIAILLSHETDPFRETAEGFRSQLSADGLQVEFDTISIEGIEGANREILDRLEELKPSLVLAVGSPALRAAVLMLPETPRVASLVMSLDEIAETPNTTGVTLSYPVETELETLKRILPRHRRIGVLYDPEHNERRITDARHVASRLGLELIAIEVGSPKEVPKALKSLTRGIDVLWGFPDPTVFTPQTAKQVLLVCMRERIPFVGLSSAWVEAGALYALERDYSDLGAQSGSLAGEILGGRSIASIPPATPRATTYTINLRTAELLKLDLPQELVDGAGRVVR